MKLIRKLIISLTVLFFGICHVNAQKKLLTFGLWADCQYADINDTADRSCRGSKERLQKTINEFNRAKMPFSVSLGDIVDRGRYYSFMQIDSVLTTADSTVYHVAGNHDFLSNSVQWISMMQSLGLYENMYYSIVRNGVRLIFLDSNERTLYSTCFDDRRRKDAENYRDSLNDSGVRIYDYNGSVGRMQMQWLEGELSQAQQANQIVVLFSHHPMFHIFEQVVSQNARQVRALLERYPCVKAHFSGHFHLGGYAKHNGIHYLIHQGMLMKKTENYFSKITIFDDRIDIEGNAKAKRVMKF